MKSLQEAERALGRKEQDLDNIAQALEQHNEEYKKLEMESHELEMERVMAKIKKNVDVLEIAALQKKYKKCEEISNKTGKLMFPAPVLKEKLSEIKDKNNELFSVVEQLKDKYAQYADLFTPLLDTHKINAQI